MSPANERIITVDPAGGGLAIGPGSTVRRAVSIQNRSTHAKEFVLEVAQVVPGGAGVVAETRRGIREGAAAWVTLDRSRFVLQPDQRGTAMATVRIPRLIKPGSKPFAVVATQHDVTGPASPQETSPTGVTPTFAQTAIFVLEIPGDAPVRGSIERADVTSAQKRLAAAGDQDGATPKNSRVYVGPGLTGTHRLTATIAYRNDGERLITARGKVVVRDLFGRTVGRYPISEFRSYPGGSASAIVELRGLPSLGWFRTSVELDTDAGNISRRLSGFALLPKWFPAAVTGLVLVAVGRLVRRRRREAAATYAEWSEDEPWEIDDESA
ncbi:MAG: hypothetical protein JWO69_23 [Thermoleophilia bacterium]|nr:hypothetical protein [Thermoleophilia bacterium]